MATPKAPLTLESAIALAAAPLGGVTNASLHIGRERTVVAHAANKNRKEMLRLDDAIMLDQLCADAGGGTPILEFYKSALDHEEAPHVSYHAHLANMVRDSARLFEDMATSLTDNRLSLDEKAKLKRGMESLRVALGRLESDLEAE